MPVVRGWFSSLAALLIEISYGLAEFKIEESEMNSDIPQYGNREVPTDPNNEAG